MKRATKICIVVVSVLFFGVAISISVVWLLCYYDAKAEKHLTPELKSIIEQYNYKTLSSLLVDDTARIDSTLFYVYETKDKVIRFYDVFEYRHRLVAVVENAKLEESDTVNVVLFYDRYEDGDNYMEDGSFYPFSYYVRNKYLYVVTNIGAMSNGWLTEYQLFKVDMETLSSLFILDCAAIAVDEPNGFVAAQGRLTNEEEASCVADEIWVMHDVYLDWRGRLNRISCEEYDCGKTMEEKYYNNDYNYPCLNKGFNSSISNKKYK